MAAEQNKKAQAWALYDVIVQEAEDRGGPSPWFQAEGGALRYEPDYDTLQRLLGVPLYLAAGTQSGVPALALDVWISYELRRAGFDPDVTWPRATHPRILPLPVARFIASLPQRDQAPLLKRLERHGNITGVTSASASILGKNYFKQVDVIMTDWATGPELLISTKRMDSSFGKNAANRVEESYGDAKNLRLRHPQAALGFVFALRSTILQEEPQTAEWLIDLLGKLGKEDDAYHATCLILMDYGSELLPPVDGGEPENDPVTEVSLAAEDEVLPAGLTRSDVPAVLNGLPNVKVVHERIPANLAPARFLATMINHVLDATPVSIHKRARSLRRAAQQS